jgi:hypothetical protein
MPLAGLVLLKSFEKLDLVFQECDRASLVLKVSVSAMKRLDLCG